MESQNDRIEWYPIGRYPEAAEQGDAAAQFNLGLRYAVEGYTEAAERGYVVAQHVLGFCYFAITTDLV